MLLLPVLDRHDVTFATSETELVARHRINGIEMLPDCNQKQPLRCVLCAFGAFRLLLKTRPDVVISTGAAPGLFCIMVGRIMGARTLWIDSVANGEQLSLSGKLAKHIAHECLTQWPHLSDGERVRYRGAVL